MTKDRSLAGRAAIAVALLVGLYVLAAVVLLTLLVLNVGVVVWADRIVPGLIFGSLVSAAALVKALLMVERRGPDVAVGVRVDRRTQPALVDLVHDVADRMGTRPPSRIWLVPEVNAFVHQHGRLIGLLPGRRVMAIGVGLIESTDVEGLRAVIAHELGHYSGGDTHLGPLVYRGSAAIARIRADLGDSAVGAVFAAYGRIYQRVTCGVRRSQELAADQTAAQLTGRDTVARVLVEMDLAAHAYERYVASYIGPAWACGRHPLDFYGGFRALLGDETHAAELHEARRAQPTVSQTSDSHPSTTERLIALGVDPGSTPSARSAPAARGLLVDPETIEEAVALDLARKATNGAALQPLSWVSYGEAVLRPTLADRSQAVVAALSQLRPPVTPSLSGLLDVIAADRIDELLDHLVLRWRALPEPKRRRQAVQVLAPAIAGLLAEALQSAGRGAWQLSWSSKAAFVDGDRVALPVWELAEQAAGSPEGAADVRATMLAIGVFEALGAA